MSEFSYIESLYDGISKHPSIHIGQTISQQYNIEQNINPSDTQFLYGETPLSTISTLLNIISPRHGDKFYDLGSGCGKIVIGASIMSEFRCCVGIELNDKLHEIATKALHILSTKHNLCLSKKIIFQNADFLEADWSDGVIIFLISYFSGDIIFINSTAFSPDIMAEITKKCENLKIHSSVITISHPLSSPMLGIIAEYKLPMSWGPSTIYIHRKMHNRKLEGVIHRNFNVNPLQKKKNEYKHH